MFFCRQKINFIIHAFMEILQRYKTYFEYFEHAWLHSPKMIVSTCRRLQCLSAWKEQTSSFTSFVIYERVYEMIAGTPTGTPLCQIYCNTHAQFRGNPKFLFSRCGHIVKTDSLTFSSKRGHKRER